MHTLTTIDWAWIAGLLLLGLCVSLYHARSASRSIQSYFAAGRDIPWWVLGTSIVATTFSADTPLVVAGLVLTEGIAGNWFWWSVAPSGMLGVFFFAHLWRRSGCLTQAEFATIRYGAARARTLRLFHVIYHGLLRNAVTLGFVNVAMTGIIVQCTGIEKQSALLICFAVTVVYAVLGGVSGVMWMDAMLFAVAMAGSIGVAWFAVQHTGGLGALRESFASGGAGASASQYQSALLRYVPAGGTTAWWAFVLYNTLYWVSCTSTDCNGYSVQRLISARNEKHAIWGYLWFNVAHYVVRSWPWILVALVGAVLYPAPESKPAAERTYIRVMLDTSPSWLIGPALASLVAAYMSTVNTHLNWGASYVVNDLYAPYLRPGRSARHYVRAGQIATVLVAAMGVAATFLMGSIVEGWGLLNGMLSGVGVVNVLRWLWWRVTAWTEIGCMVGAGAATVAMESLAPDVDFPFNLLVIVPASLLGAAVGTYAVAPEPMGVLTEFVGRVRPPGPGWNAVRRSMARVRSDAGPASGGEPHSSSYGMGNAVLCWVLGTAAVFCALFGLGDLLLKSAVRGALLCGLALLLALVVGVIYRADLDEGGPVGDAAPSDSPPTTGRSVRTER